MQEVKLPVVAALAQRGLARGICRKTCLESKQKLCPEQPNAKDRKV